MKPSLIRIPTRLAFAGLGVVAAFAAQTPWASAQAHDNVSVTVGINRPGVYGQVTIGTPPPPALVIQQPVVVVRQPVVVQPAPVYLYVPVYQQSRWPTYCGQYGACGRQVYFVREDWVRERYAQEHPQWGRGNSASHRQDYRHGHNGRGHRADGDMQYGYEDGRDGGGGRDGGRGGQGRN